MNKIEIKKEVEEIIDYIINIRHKLHENPEIGYKEYVTSKILKNELVKLNIKIDDKIYKTGICALLNGEKEGKTILIRADIDALAIEEKTNLPYTSKNKGFMHACGHDVHSAVVLGTAVVLNKLSNKFSGNVKFVFQPAEEQEGGALGMIKNGVLDNPKVDAALGFHVWGSAQKGKVEIKKGALMASPDRFFIKILGAGGHAANPHQCVDPIIIAVRAINEFQNIISRQTDPTDPAVISVCHIEGGNTHNVIPDDVLIEGTVRTLNNDTRNKIPELMKTILKNITEIYGADFEFEYEYSFPPLFNDNNMTELVKRSAEEIMGNKNVIEIDKPNLGGEDFSYFAQKVPSSYFYLGIAPSKDEVIKHHNPKFIVDDNVIKDGIAIMVNSVINYLNQ